MIWCGNVLFLTQKKCRTNQPKTHNKGSCVRFSHSSLMMALSLFVCVCSFSFITTFVMMMIFGGCSLRLTRRDDYDDRLVNYIIILPTTDLPQAKSERHMRKPRVVFPKNVAPKIDDRFFFPCVFSQSLSPCRTLEISWRRKNTQTRKPRWWWFFYFGRARENTLTLFLSVRD